MATFWTTKSEEGQELDIIDLSSLGGVGVRWIKVWKSLEVDETLKFASVGTYVREMPCIELKEVKINHSLTHVDGEQFADDEKPPATEEISPWSSQSSWDCWSLHPHHFEGCYCHHFDLLQWLPELG